MILLKFKVAHQKISGGRYRPVSNTYGYIDAEFDFTDDWEGLSKWAHFTKGETVYDIAVDEDDCIRGLALAAGTWEIKLHGDDNIDGVISQRITTDKAYIVIEDYGADEDGEVFEETVPADVASQIDAKATDAVRKAENAVSVAESVREDADSGLFNGVSVVSVEQTVESTESEGVNEVSVYLSDGQSFTFEVRNGKQGEQGIQGEQGFTGPQGETGTSAYEYALLGGFEGTAEEFAEMLARETDATFEIEGAAADSKAVGEKFGELDSAIEDIIAELNYEEIEITKFTMDVSSPQEMGAEVSPINFEWTFNKAAQSYSFDGTTYETVSEGGAFRLNETVSATRSFVLRGTDEKGATAEKTLTLAFYNGIYYGAGGAEADTGVLTKILSGTRKRTFSANAGEGKYIWYILPARLGECAFKVGGFDGGFDLIKTEDFENASGFSESYLFYRSANANLGSTTVEVS